MNSPWSISIRSGLLLLVFLAVLPSLALQVYDGYARRRHLITDAEQEVRRTAASLAQTQASLTQSTQLLLSTLATMPEVRQQDTAACSSLFASLLKENPIYINILSTNRQGDIIASALPYESVNLADRKHFKAAIASGHFSAGEYIVSRTAFGPAFPFSLPYRDRNGNIAGVLIAAIRLASYDAAFDQMRLPAGSTLGITDQQGIRLYYRPKSQTNPLGNPIRPEVWKTLSAKGEEGSFLETASDGSERLFGFKKLFLAPGQPPYMTFVVGLPEDLIFAAARKVLLTNLGLLAATAGLALGVAWLIGGAIIAKRLDRIADTASRIGQGELTARTGLLHGQGGIGKVARDIDAMAQLLASHEAAREQAVAALRQSQERMAHITASMADWIWEIDEKDRYVHVSPKVRQALGYTPDALLGKTPFDFLAPGEETSMRQVYATAKAQRAPLRELATWRLDKAGARRCILTSGIAWIDESGRFRGYRGVDTDVTERVEAERNIRESLAEKETLLKEIHHRVKNNLQIISGLLYLQEEKVTDPTALESFRESRNRIASMALVHEELYRSANLSRVGLDTYIRELLPRLFNQTGQGPRVTFECRLDPVRLPIEKAVPSGLALNELLTNAYKHAFEGRESGLLRVTLQEKQGLVTVTVADDGPGLPPDFQMETGATLGMQLVVNLARQLGGSIEAHTDCGAVFTLTFPKGT